MIIGDPNTLAIESEIDQVFDTPTGRRALGFFCVHVGGFRYGVKESDATMLGNSVDEVGRRIAQIVEITSLSSPAKTLSQSRKLSGGLSTESVSPAK